MSEAGSRPSGHNGFQILCEAGLLPGVLMRNASLQFRCKDTHLIPSNLDTPFTTAMRGDRTYQIPMSHGEGRYVISRKGLELLKNNDQVAFRYGSESGEISDIYNPNGSVDNIAGVFNEGHNVLGMMPHPERACEKILGTADGNWIWRSVISSMESE